MTAYRLGYALGKALLVPFVKPLKKSSGLCYYDRSDEILAIMDRVSCPFNSPRMDDRSPGGQPLVLIQLG
jgi:hypothetical protein